MLAPGQTAFTAEGTRCFDSQQPDPPGSWQSRFTETDAGVTGNPVAPTGHALPRTVHLPRTAWTCALQGGDTVLDMHIPAGGGMTLETCVQSFRAAADFFRKYLPDQQAKAITSGSWMFSDQLEQALPPEANLVRLLRELYLVPTPCRPNAGLWFVFLQSPFDPTTAPRETSLQRAILAYLARGNAWRVSGMFLLLDDLPRVGTQPYRRSSLDLAARLM